MRLLVPALLLLVLAALLTVQNQKTPRDLLIESEIQAWRQKMDGMFREMEQDDPVLEAAGRND